MQQSSQLTYSIADGEHFGPECEPGPDGQIQFTHQHQFQRRLFARHHHLTVTINLATENVVVAALRRGYARIRMVRLLGHCLVR